MVKVNGEEIPEAAIEFELERLIRFYAQHMDESQVRAQMDSLKKRAKEQAIGAKLLINEAVRMDIAVSEDEVDGKFNYTVQGAGGEEAFKDMLAQQGYTEQMVRDNIREGCKVDKLVEKITEGLSDPTEEEIKAHFESHTEEYERPERAQGQHILVKSDSDSNDDKEAARKKLEDIRQQALAGSDFAELAAAHSDCPSGKRAGGSLGWFSRGMMVPEFDNAVFSMEVGDLSDIIETRFGYHIIRKTGHEDAQPASYEEVSGKVREFLRHVQRGEILSAYVAGLRGKAVIEDE